MPSCRLLLCDCWGTSLEDPLGLFLLQNWSSSVLPRDSGLVVALLGVSATGWLFDREFSNPFLTNVCQKCVWAGLASFSSIIRCGPVPGLKFIPKRLRLYPQEAIRPQMALKTSGLASAWRLRSIWVTWSTVRCPLCSANLAASYRAKIPQICYR